MKHIKQIISEIMVTVLIQKYFLAKLKVRFPVPNSGMPAYTRKMPWLVVILAKIFIPQKSKQLDDLFAVFLSNAYELETEDYLISVIQNNPKVLDYGVAQLILENLNITPTITENFPLLIEKCISGIHDQEYLKKFGGKLFDQVKWRSELWGKSMQIYLVHACINVFRSCHDNQGIEKCADWIDALGEAAYPNHLHMIMELYLEALAYNKAGNMAKHMIDCSGNHKKRSEKDLISEDDDFSLFGFYYLIIINSLKNSHHFNDSELLIRLTVGIQNQI